MDRLYWAPDNANLPVRMVLHELDVPYEAISVDRGHAAHKAADYLALNPQGLLPVLIADGQDAPLFETAAILLHLAERSGGLIPAAAEARGRLLKWLFFISNTLHADLRILFHPERYVADPAAVPGIRLAVHQRVEGHLALLDQAIEAAGGPWFLGQPLTVLDPYLACCLRWAQLYPPGEALPVGAIRARPALCRLLEALGGRPTIRTACAREGIAGGLFLDPSLPEPM